MTALLFVINQSWKLSKHPSTLEWINKLQFAFIGEYHTAMGLSNLQIYAAIL